MHWWAKNVDEKSAELFFKYADFFVELYKGDDEMVKAGKAIENLPLYVMDNASFLLPEDIKSSEEFHIEAAEYYLEAGSLRADQVINRVRNSVRRTHEQALLWIRFKSAQARLADQHRRYGTAAYNYLSVLKDAEALDVPLEQESKIQALTNAAVCAILDKHGPSRTSILADICSHYLASSVHCSSILQKITNGEIVAISDQKLFEQNLQKHHLGTMADGRTIVENAMIRHNVSVVSA
eukprot:UN24061